MENEGEGMKKKHSRDFSRDTGTYALPFLQYLDSFLIFFKKRGSREKNDGRGNKQEE